MYLCKHRSSCMYMHVQAKINYKTFMSSYVVLKSGTSPLLINYSGWKPYSPGFFITQSSFRFIFS